VDAVAAAEALAALEPEADRARVVAARRGPGAKTARYLAARGFDPQLAAEAAGRSVAADD
jgi:SOS response regulatory protein OraA/RecX